MLSRFCDNRTGRSNKRSNVYTGEGKWKTPWQGVPNKSKNENINKSPGKSGKKKRARKAIKIKV